MTRRLSRVRAAVRRHRVATAAGVALAVLCAAGAGELTARDLLRDRIAGAAPALGGDVTVGGAGGSVLWDLMTRHIPRLDVGSDHAGLGPLPDVSFRAHLDDVRLGGPGRGSVAGTRAEVTVPTGSIGAAVEAVVRATHPSMPVASVDTDPAAGTVTVALGPGGVGLLTLRPAVTGGRVTLTVASLTVLGRPVAADALGGPGGLGGGLGALPGPQRPYPLGLTATSVRTLPTGLTITLKGGPSTLGGS
ncbi:LmeA family phospholipid-binding protein [Kitasatospora paranensis]|uniref:LmeA family phospholipid-binding protein n=1 Tax=Kitasatospora paranensis TaxID=258053 RepID=A0ABW2G571_9ACTN